MYADVCIHGFKVPQTHLPMCKGGFGPCLFFMLLYFNVSGYAARKWAALPFHCHATVILARNSRGNRVKPGLFFHIQIIASRSPYSQGIFV